MAEGMEKNIDIEALLSGGQSIQLYPQGYSMYPLLVPGRDEVILSPLPERVLRRGDVALYRRDTGILVLHRIWRCKEDGYYMVGDNQTEIEGPLALSQVRGKMIAVIRNGKSFSTGNPLYVIFSRIWLILRPFRPVISQIIHKMHPFREAN